MLELLPLLFEEPDYCSNSYSIKDYNCRRIYIFVAADRVYLEFYCSRLDVCFGFCELILGLLQCTEEESRLFSINDE